MGVIDIYRKMPKEERTVSLEIFRKIIRRINALIGEQILEGNIIVLPHNMGSLYIGKYENQNKLVDGKLKNTMAIDWYSTLSMWEQYPETKEEKRLLKFNTQYTYKLVYDKRKATYNNQKFFRFRLNRQIKVEEKKRIQNRKTIDAFQI